MVEPTRGRWGGGSRLDRGSKDVSPAGSHVVCPQEKQRSTVLS
jgi:hypothetical protein